MQFINDALSRLKEFSQLSNHLESKLGPIAVFGVSHIHKVSIISALLNKNGGKALFLVPTEGDAQRALEDFENLGLHALNFPARDYAPRAAISHSRE
ncbi:MAG: hypothetical protein RR177_00325 [Oscillospiraceae bacterium]